MPALIGKFGMSCQLFVLHNLLHPNCIHAPDRNLHQQISMCAWSDDDTPFDIHLMGKNEVWQLIFANRNALIKCLCLTAGRSNQIWHINVTANQDWTVQRSALSRDDLRKQWGAKTAIWDGWDPSKGPFTVGANVPGRNDSRLVFQIFVPYNMTRLPFRCNRNQTERTPWSFNRLPEEMMLWPLQQDDTCLKYSNTDASIWGLESCWTQWPRDNSWFNPYLHFMWSEKSSNYTYSDANLAVMTLPTSTDGYYEAFVQRTFRNMTYYGYQTKSDSNLGFWKYKNFADWSSTPWGPTFYTTSYNRRSSWDWAWRYTGSFWYSNYHFPMVTEMVRGGDFNQGTIRGRHHWGNNQCIGKCGGV